MELNTNIIFNHNDKRCHFELLDCNLSNHIVDFKHSIEALDIEEYVANPPEKSGYTVVGAINGGAYLSSDGSPIGSCQANEIELTNELHYNDNTYGID